MPDVFLPCLNKDDDDDDDDDDDVVNTLVRFRVDFVLDTGFALV